MAIKFGRWFRDNEPVAPVRIEFDLTRADLASAAALALHSDSACADQPTPQAIAGLTAARIERELRWVLTDRGQGGLDYASDTVGYSFDHGSTYWEAAFAAVDRLWPNATKESAA